MTILRNFINEPNKHEGRFGNIRDEEKILAVKKLMSESLPNQRFRGTALPDEKLLISLENIIREKVTTHSVSKMKKTTRVHQWRLAWPQGQMAQKLLKNCTEQHPNSPCRQCTREQELKAAGMEERVLVWSVQQYFNSGKGEKRSESRWNGTVVQDWRQERERKGQDKGGKGDIRVLLELWEKQDTLRQLAPRGVGTRV